MIAKTNPYKQILGKGLNALSQTKSMLPKFGPMIAPVAGAMSFANSLTKSAYNKFSAPVAPVAPVSTGTPFNIPMGQTMVTNPQNIPAGQTNPLLSGAPQAPQAPQVAPTMAPPQQPGGMMAPPVAPPVAPVQAGGVMPPVGGTTGTTTTTGGVNSGLPEFVTATPEELALQQSLATKKSQFAQQYEDIFTPSGMKTMAGATGLAGIIGDRSKMDQANIVDELAVASGNRKEKNNFNQKNFENQQSLVNSASEQTRWDKEMAFNLKKFDAEMNIKRQEMQISREKLSRGEPLSITDQIKLNEFTQKQSADRQSAETAIPALKRLLQYKGSAIAGRDFSSGASRMATKGLTWTFGGEGRAFYDLKNLIGADAQLQASAVLKGGGSISNLERAILANKTGLNAATATEYWAAVEKTLAQVEREAYGAQDMTNEQLLAEYSALAQ